MSWIHLDDIVGIFLPPSTTPPPRARSTGRRRTRSATSSSRRPWPRSSGGRCSRSARPTSMLKLLLGEVADVVTKGQKVLPAKAQELGYRFQYPTLPEALKNIFAKVKPEPEPAEAQGARARPRPSLIAWPSAASIRALPEQPADREADPQQGQQRRRRPQGERGPRPGLGEPGQRAEPAGDRSARPGRPSAAARRRAGGLRRRAAPASAWRACGLPERIRAVEGVGRLARRSGSGPAAWSPSACPARRRGSAGRSGRRSVIGTGRPLIRLPSRSIGLSPGKAWRPVIRWYIAQPSE